MLLSATSAGLNVLSVEVSLQAAAWLAPCRAGRLCKPQVAFSVTASERMEGARSRACCRTPGQCALSSTRNSTESSCSQLHISLANAQASLTMFPAAPALSCRPCWTMSSAVLSTQDNTTQFPSVILVCQTCAHKAPSAACSSHLLYCPGHLLYQVACCMWQLRKDANMTIPVLPAIKPPGCHHGGPCLELMSVARSFEVLVCCLEQASLPRCPSQGLHRMRCGI